MLFKKSLTLASITLATAGVLAFGQDSQVSAASEWQARTVEEVQEEITENQDGSRTYTVQRGDTLAVIAKALQVDLAVLASANNISDPDVIHAGAEITISKDQKTVTIKGQNGHTTSGQTNKAATGQSQTQHQNHYRQKQATSSGQGSYKQAPAKSSYSAAKPPQQAAVNYSSQVSGGEAAAKEWIAQRESNGSYTAYNPNGGYYGRYQLNPSLVRYGASAAEQEAAADKYVYGRYGSWGNAKAHWQQKGWY